MQAFRKSIAGIIFLLMAFAGHLSAQFYSAGQDPASVNWKQINTENFRIIFPEEYEEQAAYIADILEYSYNWATYSLDHTPRKVSVIVHNRTVISNGFVSWAPGRIELFTNPSAANDAHPWMESLALHEFRHVVQIDKLNQGITRLLGYVFGEQAVGAILGVYVPLWFLEGDAVVTETALSHSGRGRQPAFEQGLRAQVLTYGPYSLDKAVFGSYKDHIPNVYELGYQLVATARVEHGPEVWSTPLNRVAHRPWSITPFSRGIKKATGRNKTEHYSHTMALLDSLWRQQKDSMEYTLSVRMNRSRKLYTNYLYPWWVNDSTLIALRTGLNDIPHVVMIYPGGVEQQLFAPGTWFPYGFHYSAELLVWSELRPDPRWEHRNASNIMLYDIKTGRRRQLTRHSRYFAPTLSPVADRVAAVETTPDDRYSLVILDTQTGEEIFRYSYPENDFIMQPSWHPDGESIVMIALDDRGKRIDVLNLAQLSITPVLEASHQEISSPRYHNDQIVFNGSWSGIDNIYRINPENSQTELIISAPFGAVNASLSPSGHALAFSNYTAQGYQIHSTTTEQLFAVPLAQVRDYSPGLHRVLAEQEKAIIARENIPRREHVAEDYNRRRHLFNPHSWAPFWVDATGQSADMGASIQSQNMLSTSFATLGYLWDRQQQTGRVKAQYSYQGWYPVLDLTAESGNSRNYYLYRDSTSISQRNFLYSETEVKLTVSVPLRFQRHEYFYGITPWVRMGIINASPNRHTPDRIFVEPDKYRILANSTHYMHEYRLLAYRQRRSVARDIYPRFGQILDLVYRHNPLGMYNMGSLFAVRGIAFLPLSSKHEGLRLSAAYQHRSHVVARPNSLAYSWGGVVAYPRGYVQQYHQDVSVFTADYVFPSWYPDLSIPYLAYMKRIRGHLFFDYARADKFFNPNVPDAERREILSSLGMGITADMHLLRFFSPLAIGVEVAFPSEGKVKANMLLGISF